MDVQHTNHTIDRMARWGVVERGELLLAGVTSDEIRARLSSGSTLWRVHPGVYATFGTSLGYEGRVLAACLAAGPGSVASHRTALKLWDLLEGDQPIDITSPRWAKPVPARVTMHRPLDLRTVDVTQQRDVPLTNPIRSLLDAGAVLTPGQVATCVELALTDDLVTVRGLRVILEDLGRKGRTGTGALRGHLDRRALGDRRPESMLEPLMARLLLKRDLGIGPVEYQATLRLEGRTLHPDFLICLPRVVVEVDGLEAHGSRTALDYDLERQNLLVRHGFLVLRYTRTHLRRPARVADEIVGASRQRLVELGIQPPAPTPSPLLLG
jgi:very-short-patch-repair endonuclease